MAGLRLFAVLAFVALLAPQAMATPGSPQDLQGSYSLSTRLVSLSWQPPNGGSAAWNYLVWRDGTFDGSTPALAYSDGPPGTVPDPGLIYFVSAAPPGNAGNPGLPAVVGVPTLSCEVVSVSTTWEAPYLYAHLHEECLGGTFTYEKDAAWTAP